MLESGLSYSKAEANSPSSIETQFSHRHTAWCRWRRLVLLPGLPPPRLISWQVLRPLLSIHLLPRLCSFSNTGLAGQGQAQRQRTLWSCRGHLCALDLSHLYVKLDTGHPLTHRRRTSPIPQWFALACLDYWTWRYVPVILQLIALPQLESLRVTICGWHTSGAVAIWNAAKEYPRLTVATRRELKQKDQPSLVRATWRRRGLVMLLCTSMIWFASVILVQGDEKKGNERVCLPIDCSFRLSFRWLLPSQLEPVLGWLFSFIFFFFSPLYLYVQLCA